MRTNEGVAANANGRIIPTLPSLSKRDLEIKKLERDT
jgi:hypothetical protein